MSVYRKKIFPLRLPEGYHGQLKTPRRLSEIVKEKSIRQSEPNPELKNSKIVSWQIKRLNKDVDVERKEYLVHTGKISHDTPHWFQTTANFYKRNQYVPQQKEGQTERRQFDIFGNKKMSMTERASASQRQGIDSFRTKRQSLVEKNCSWKVTSKIGSDSRLSSTSARFFESKVSPKIGSVDNRNFSVRKPQLKVGKQDFVDTYSPF